MSPLRKKLIVVGDRLLVKPEDGEERTHAGLYLPQTAVAARQASGGWVVSVGPGLPVAAASDEDDDLFGMDVAPARYVPMQAQEGDYCLFLKKAAVEISFEKKNYLIVPNAAVLVLVREDISTEGGDWKKEGPV